MFFYMRLEKTCAMHTRGPVDMNITRFMFVHVGVFWRGAQLTTTISQSKD
jgi:hypothetical protein